MALRTSNTRAALIGAAKQRAAMGIDTVRVSSYGSCSETCLPWQGGIYIDDVYGEFAGEISGNKGKSRSGKWYTLLSVAVKAGLFHPNCRHTLTVYIDGAKPSPVMDGEQIRKNYKLEQQQRAMEQKIRKWKRMQAAADSPLLKETYAEKVKSSQAELRAFIAENKEVLRRDPWRELTHGVKDENVKNRINRNDTEQFERYSSVLKELSPKSLEDFQKIKYNNTNEWSKLKAQYRTINQYKIDSGTFTAQQILDLDYKVISEKRNNFISAYKNSGNIAGAYINGDKDNMYIAHSQMNLKTDKCAMTYKGKSNIVLLSEELKFNYIPITMHNGKIRQDTQFDTEAKLFEYFFDEACGGNIKSITMLSERGMCDSCKGVMAQFKNLYPTIQVNAISNKKVNGNVWGNRWRKKK